MIFRLLFLCIVLTLAPFISQAGGSSPAVDAVAPPDPAKLSYAVGTRMGLQMQNAGAKVDAKVALQAIKDVLEGKETRLEEGEITSILSQGQQDQELDRDAREKFSYAGGMRIALMYKRSGFELEPKVIFGAIQDQLHDKSKMDETEVLHLFKSAAAYDEAKKNLSNSAEGKAFLEKNATQPGVKVLPDGLQYQVLREGTGPLSTTNDLIFVRYRGTLINGTEFDRHDHYLTRTYGGIQGWRDVLPLMKVGSKWRIFAPGELAFKANGYPSRGVGPGTTVIYDLELLSIAPPNGSYQISSGLGRGADVDATLPETAPVK
jgi:FKBP-type peptidyl-prolyl cis-trans isomerase FklB